VATVPAGKGEAGEQARGRKTTVVITQYPWAPPSGRAALIAMPGLLLVTGRVEEAKSLLEGLLARMDGKGLVPSDFAEDGSGPVYRGADTSLWFVNAVYHYLRYSGDERGVRRRFWLAVKEIVRAYRDGTVGLGVQMNAEGLVSSRVAGAATSWMDAKVGDWVVTPRQGKCVELNALWYNVLRVAADLAERFDEHRLAGELTGLAGSVKEAFNRSFWNEAAGCCFDVVDGGAKDGAVRPNQLLAVSLPFAVLDMERQGAVVEKVRKELLTPVGVRTLAPSDPNYQGHYRGGVVARDRAMHQGTAYPWLLGALVSAYVRVNGRGEETRAEARKMVDGCLCYMREEGIGQICELFDGDAPHHGGGGIASALSVGEILRCWMEDVLDQGAPAAAGGAGAAPLSQDEPARVSVRQGA
jgi:predicted glycogen debranching enzyme